MEFSAFLDDLRRQRRCSTPKELFEALGSEEKLGIAFRTFRAVYSGQIPPSLKFFFELFKQLANHQKKDAIVSFFQSSSDSQDSKPLVEFLSEKLSVSMASEVKSLWSENEPQLFSEKQLRLLSSSNDAVRVYTRLVIHACIFENELKTVEQRNLLNKFVEYGFAVRQGNKYIPSNTLFRFPHQSNSPKELVAPANDVILRFIHSYIAREGAPGEQEIGFSFHSCLRKDAEKIIEQMQNFKRWVQSLGLSDDHPDEVSFVWVDFGRIIKKGRDY